MSVVVKSLKVEDLLTMPDDGRQIELLRGELIEMPPLGKRHGRLVAKIVRLLGKAIEDEGLGAVVAESGVAIERDPPTVLAPDVAVYLGVPMSALDEPEGYGDRLPDIVVEVISPSDSAEIVQDKLVTYLDAGVQLAIAVWPRRQELTVASPDGEWQVVTDADVLDLTALVPDLKLPVASFFS